MRQSALALFPPSRYSTSCRLSVIGAPSDFGGADIESTAFRDKRLKDEARRRPFPAIAENRLPAGERRERGGVGAKHARPQTDGRNKWQFAEGVKLGTMKPAFGPGEHGETAFGLHARKSFADRLGPAELGADDEPALR